MPIIPLCITHQEPQIPLNIIGSEKSFSSMIGEGFFILRIYRWSLVFGSYNRKVRKV